MSEKERMLAGRLYSPFDEELAKDNKRARRLTREFNNATEDEMDRRTSLLQSLFKAAGDKIYIEPPFRTDYGCNTVIGDNFYANYDCIIIDVCPVTIGNNVFLGPRVGIYTATHPIDAAVRNSLIESGLPISIGDDVWVGGNTVINPGVTIGSNVVIGSGSVVVKDIPSGVVAVGNPAKPIRDITAADKEKWDKLAEAYHAELQSETSD